MDSRALCPLAQEEHSRAAQAVARVARLDESLQPRTAAEELAVQLHGSTVLIHPALTDWLEAHTIERERLEAEMAEAVRTLNEAESERVRSLERNSALPPRILAG